MKIIGICYVFVCLACYNGYGQYYYKDIVSNKEASMDLAIFKKEKIRKVVVNSLESDGLPSEGFYCHKKINNNFNEIEIVTSTATSYKTILTSFFSDDGLLLKSYDSSEVSATEVIYNYNQQNNIVKITSESRFEKEDESNIISEEHLYTYKNDKPEKLTVVKNKKDTTIIVFSTDEMGNIGIEKNTLTGDIYYYYYDSKNRLTNVVHKYKTRNKLTTDYIFDYNPSGQLIKMTTGQEEGAYFFVWRYNYEGLLRVSERCYSKEGKLLGTIEFDYK